MYKLLEIIKKNFRLVTRTRSSALIVILGPLILMLLISLAFNTSSLFDIRIGAYSSSYSDLSNSLITQLEDDQFKVIKIESEEKCINDVKDGNLHVCTVFPADLTVKTSGNIIFYVDKTRLNFVYIVINSISQKVGVKSAELSTALTNTLLSSLTNANTKLSTVNLAEVISSLSATSSQITSVSSDISNIDVGSNKTGLNVSSLEDEIFSIQTSANLSSATFSQLNSLIDSLRNEISGITSKLDSVSSIKESTSSELSNIKSGIDTSTGNIENLEANINEIVENINAIEIKEVEKIVSPVSTEIKAVSAEETHLSITFPALVILVVLFAGILLASTTIVQEKESKAYFRNFITPTKDLIFIIGNYLSTILIILVQLLIIFLVMVYATDASLTEGVISNVFIVLLLVASIFIFIGMIIGYLFKSGETANIAAVSVSSILLFFSNTILPIETLPTGVRAIANLNPFVIGESALRKILLFNASLDAVGSQIFTLLIYFILLAILTYVAREFTKRRFM